jgi:hypothetical protein
MHAGATATLCNLSLTAALVEQSKAIAFTARMLASPAATGGCPGGGFSCSRRRPTTGVST